MGNEEPLTIRSERLDLVSLSRELMDALLAGDRKAVTTLAAFQVPDEYPSREDLEQVRFRCEQVRHDPTWAPWSLRAVVLRQTSTMIGFATFHGPPGVNDNATPGAVEVGYTISRASESWIRN